jgi:hypothetical protein
MRSMSAAMNQPRSSGHYRLADCHGSQIRRVVKRVRIPANPVRSDRLAGSETNPLADPWRTNAVSEVSPFADLPHTPAGGTSPRCRQSAGQEVIVPVWEFHFVRVLVGHLRAGKSCRAAEPASIPSCGERGQEYRELFCDVARQNPLRVRGSRRSRWASHLDAPGARQTGELHFRVGLPAVGRGDRRQPTDRFSPGARL